MSAPVFLVTGGSRGIGEAIALAAGRDGFHVLLTYVESGESAEAVAAKIRAAGGEATALQADTSRQDDVERLFGEADRIGRLAVLIYNSGITGATCTLAQVAPDKVARVLEVNLLGAILCAREAVLRMSTAKGGQGGSIVLISSRATVYGSPNQHVWYAASKGGVDSFTIGLAREVAMEGIRVNAVSPGPIATGMLPPERLEIAAKLSPMQRVGRPEEVAAAVMFLASDAASYITGANLAVGGGR